MSLTVWGSNPIGGKRHLFSEMCRTSVEATQPHIQLVRGLFPVEGGKAA